VWVAFSAYEVVTYITHLVDCFLVWLLSFGLSSKDDPTSSYITVGIAFGVTGVQKPFHLFKVVQFLGRVVQFRCTVKGT
jgi:hypothetical protein